MQHSFWHQRWQDNRIGFHLDETNVLLKKHLACLQLQKDDVFFVPLCGKTLDLLFLSQCDFKVIGNELSPLAVKDFFNENNINYTTTSVVQNKELLSFQSKDIEIINGDFFSLDENILKDVNAVYDRASMIALPESIRKKYVQHLLKLLPQKIKILLITLEYDQNLKEGPPFSISKQEVADFYAKDFDISLLESETTVMKLAGNESQQLNILENVYLLNRE